MSSLKDLVALGKELGYDGQSLRKFIQEEQSREREERVKARYIEREERVKVMELERESEERKRAFEKEKIELEKLAEKERIT